VRAPNAVDAQLSTALPSDWTLVDLALGLGLGLSVLVGAWRGLVTEMLALFGWGVAYFSAQWFGPQAALHVPVGESGSRVNVLAGMMVVFVTAWLAWALLSWGVRAMVRASGLSGADRLLGAAFGLIRGVLVALVLYTLVSMTPMTRWGPWQASHAVPWLQVLMQGLKPVLPEDVSRYLPDTALNDGPGPSEKIFLIL
jgi:membrane protein required for colicin V production